MITHQEWLQEGTRLFGPNILDWKFVCPSCGHIASIRDWKNAGATKGEIAFSCIGRHLPNPKELGQRPGPCNYAGGGLFRLNPVHIAFDNGETTDVFEFAKEERAA